jgi:hypothetical protein
MVALLKKSNATPAISSNISDRPAILVGAVVDPPNSFPSQPESRSIRFDSRKSSGDGLSEKVVFSFGAATVVLSIISKPFSARLECRSHDAKGFHSMNTPQ